MVKVLRLGLEYSLSPRQFALSLANELVLAVACRFLTVDVGC